MSSFYLQQNQHQMKSRTNSSSPNFKSRSHASRKVSTKLSDMHTHRTKMHYNIMGEPVKVKIQISRKSHVRGRKRGHKSREVDLSSPFRMGSFASETHPTTNSYSATDLMRTTHALREILFGKVRRDILQPSPEVGTTSLSEVLRFYCETCFGATSVAESRQTNLFNAILALQGASPLMRVMKRLLCIPGISPFAEDHIFIYMAIWGWVLRQDILVDGSRRYPSTPRLNPHVPAKNLVIPITCIIQCLKEIGRERGNFFPPDMYKTISDQMLLLPEYIPSLDCVYTQRKDNTHTLASNEKYFWVDIDEGLEIILEIIERRDKESSLLIDSLFGSLVTEDTVLITVARDIIAPGSSNVVKSVKNRKQHRLSLSDRLKDIKELLDEFITNDDTRSGSLPHKEICRIMESWYDIHLTELIFHRNCVNDVLHFFNVKGDALESTCYINIIGLIYTISLQEGEIPSCDKMCEYLSQPHCGIDVEHYEHIEEYIKVVRMSNFRSFLHVNMSEVKCRDTDIIDHSKRSVTRIQPDTNGQGFMSKWASTGTFQQFHSRGDRNTKNLYKHQAEKLDSALSMRLPKERPRTPLHLIQPKLLIEAPLSQTYQSPRELQCKNNNACKLDQVSHTFCATNIYVRFPEAEPFKTKLHGTYLSNCDNGKRKTNLDDVDAFLHGMQDICSGNNPDEEQYNSQMKPSPRLETYDDCIHSRNHLIPNLRSNPDTTPYTQYISINENNSITDSVRQSINTNGSKLESHVQKEDVEFEFGNKNQDKSSDTEKHCKQVIDCEKQPTTKDSYLENSGLSVQTSTSCAQEVADTNMNIYTSKSVETYSHNESVTAKEKKLLNSRLAASTRNTVRDTLPTGYRLLEAFMSSEPENNRHRAFKSFSTQPSTQFPYIINKEHMVKDMLSSGKILQLGNLSQHHISNLTIMQAILLAKKDVPLGTVKVLGNRMCHTSLLDKNYLLPLLQGTATLTTHQLGILLGMLKNTMYFAAYKQMFLQGCWQSINDLCQPSTIVTSTKLLSNHLILKEGSSIQYLLGGNLSGQNIYCLIDTTLEWKSRGDSTELKTLTPDLSLHESIGSVFNAQALTVNQSDWHTFFDCEERNLLFVASTFYRAHQCLFLHRSRHYIDQTELRTIASCASFHMRKSVRKRVYLSGRQKTTESMTYLQSRIYEHDQMSGSVIGSLSIETGTKKEGVNMTMYHSAVHCPAWYRSALGPRHHKNNIFPVKYRITR